MCTCKLAPRHRLSAPEIHGVIGAGIENSIVKMTPGKLLILHVLECLNGFDLLTRVERNVPQKQRAIWGHRQKQRLAVFFIDYTQAG